MEWTIKNDLQAVEVGINVRIGMAKRNRQRIVAILLGREHSRLFLDAFGLKAIPNEYYYGRDQVPIRFNVKDLYGIAAICINRDESGDSPSLQQ